MSWIRRYVSRILLGGVALVALIQLVPYGRSHTNPKATKSPMFASARAQQIFTAACADCHSYKTKWPWYTNVAPISWLVQKDVDEGRDELNLSAWDTAQPAVDEVAEQIQDGEMPPLKYTVVPNHADARLSDAEKRILIAGLREIYATDPPAAIRQGGEG